MESIEKNTKEIIKTYQFKILPLKKQYQVLDCILENQRLLYNAALQERIEYYQKVILPHKLNSKAIGSKSLNHTNKQNIKSSITLFDQYKSLSLININP